MMTIGCSTFCADVRTVLKGVFREENHLPPSTTASTVPVGDDGKLPKQGQWIDKYTTECTEIWTQETKLKHEHARRLSKAPLPNIYQLSLPSCGCSSSDVSSWRLRQGIVARRDLMPSLEQDAGRDVALWVQNILNSSSRDFSCIEMQQGLHSPLPLIIPSPREDTLHSLSIGEPVVRRPPPPPSAVPPPLSPECIVCIPPQLDFVNFSIGHLYTQSIRLVNVSKIEVRLSLRPPSRRELDLVLSSARGLTVTAGATAKLRVLFRPRDPCALHDALHVRVSAGQEIVVPIHCYLQPPKLEVIISNTSWLSSSSPSEELHEGGDVLDLGARLLGDVHCAHLRLYSDDERVEFFVLTEDAWISFCLDTLTHDGAVVSGPFTMSPAWWRGGGPVSGNIWCRAPHVGLHVAAMRVLALTASVPHPLHILADALHFTPDHLSLEAQEKDYDICSEDDSACKYYVHLGAGFPNRGLSETVKLVNHSPVAYSYYWQVRLWGMCSCWEEESKDYDKFRVATLETQGQDKKGPTLALFKADALMIVEPASGLATPRSQRALRVHVPDVGARLGTQRAVLMLILKDIPKESFPLEYDPILVKTETVLGDTFPGQKPWYREVCEVVCSQLEVWWEVVPIRFLLEPPLLPLPYSRRIKKIQLTLRATQLFGCEEIQASWCASSSAPTPQQELLTAARGTPARLELPLSVLPNEHPATEVFVLEAAKGEWRSQSALVLECATRHPQLRPVRAWLGAVPPAAHVNTLLHVLNDTHQHIFWSGTPFRWYGGNQSNPACECRESYEQCRQRRCACGPLRPARGALEHCERATLNYHVNAPDKEGCVATLLQVRRTLGDKTNGASGPAGCDARASLVAYRVITPRVHLRVVPCHGEREPDECAGCSFDPGIHKAGGTAVLRPSRALVLGRSTCYRLRLTNITPIPTTVRWEPSIEKDVLKVTFIPNDFDVGSYAQVEIRVVIEAQRVCRRRIFVNCARLERACTCIFLLVDTAVSGLEVLCEMPLGGEKYTSFVTMRRTQKQVCPREEAVLTEEVFAQEDRRRAGNTCHCKLNLVYIPPVKPTPGAEPDVTISACGHGHALTRLTRSARLMKPSSRDNLRTVKGSRLRDGDCQISWAGAEEGSERVDVLIVEICEPPVARVCACDELTTPVLPEYQEPFCLQFKTIRLKTVQTRTLMITNQSALASRWSSTVRNWPRQRRRTLTHDAWSMDVQDPGICVEVSPAGGVLAPRARIQVTVSVYADCWGLYRDQVMIHIEKVDPLILDLWVEAVGAPLQFAMDPQEEEESTLWMSSSDPKRVVRFKNTSRSDLVVHVHVLRRHEHQQDLLPFRVYFRFFDVPPPSCPCEASAVQISSTDPKSENTVTKDRVQVEGMGTGLELILTADCGLQQDTCFKVDPVVSIVSAGAHAELHVDLAGPAHGELAPDAVLMFRALPIQAAGPGWHRHEQPPQLLRLRQTPREGVLHATRRRLCVKYCALDLPPDNVIIRIRKHFHIKNTGNGPLSVTASTRPPWTIVSIGTSHPCIGCGCDLAAERAVEVPLYLMPRSSTEMTVEVCINTAEAWPGSDAESAPQQDQWTRTCTPLLFYDDDNVLLNLSVVYCHQTVSLMLELEYPILNLEPAVIDFGCVTDGDTRKAYFTVTHTSRTKTLDLVTEWVGDGEVTLWPQRLRLQPGTAARVYLQYTARWHDGIAEGCARLAYALHSTGAGGAGVTGAAGGSGAWCRASLSFRATPTLDYKYHALPHDDTKLLPSGLTIL